MLFDIAVVAGGMVRAFLGSLNEDSRTVKALAEDEARKLSMSLLTIGQLLKDGEIGRDEAEALIEVQRAATETVFASLEGISRVAARNAVRAALSGAAAVVDGAIGLPLVGTLVNAGAV